MAMSGEGLQIAESADQAAEGEEGAEREAPGACSRSRAAPGRSRGGQHEARGESTSDAGVHHRAEVGTLLRGPPRPDRREQRRSAIAAAIRVAGELPSRCIPPEASAPVDGADDVGYPWRTVGVYSRIVESVSAREPSAEPETPRSAPGDLGEVVDDVGERIQEILDAAERVGA